MPSRPPLTVSVSDATDRQLLIAALTILHRLETGMSELAQSVADLKAAVVALATRVSGQVAPLNAALAQAVQSLADFQSSDATEDAAFQATIDDLTAQLSSSLADAQAAAADISDSVVELNSIAEAPPVEEPAAEPQP